MENHEHGSFGALGGAVHCRYPGNLMTNCGRRLREGEFRPTDRPVTCRNCLPWHTHMLQAGPAVRTP